MLCRDKAAASTVFLAFPGSKRTGGPLRPGRGKKNSWWPCFVPAKCGRLPFVLVSALGVKGQAALKDSVEVRKMVGQNTATCCFLLLHSGS